MPEVIIANTKIHIEVPLLLMFFAFSFSESVRTNLIIFRTCYITLGKNKSECALLGTDNKSNETADLEKLVEPYAAVLNMVHSLVDSLFSTAICLFAGPWSDKFGRKPFLTYPVIGYIMYFVFLSIFAHFEMINPWYILLCSVPIYLTGGGSSYLTVILSYIADVTNETNRGLRMAVFETILSLGIFFGNISSGYAFNATGYSTIFLISAVCCLGNFTFTLVFVPESLPNPETEGRLKGLFRLTNVKEMVVTTFKKRPFYNRFIVLCSVLMLTLFILMINGDGAVVFYFLRKKFLWSLEQYTLYSAAHNVAWVIGTIIGTYVLHKLFKIPEHLMIPIGFTSMFLGMLWMGLAKTNWEIYIASCIRSLGGVLSPMIRTMVSKIIPSEELGKVFALIVISESLIGMGGSPMFTAIYNTTINIDPSIFNFVEAGFYGIEILIALGIVFVRKYPNVVYEKVDEVDSDEVCDTTEVA